MSARRRHLQWVRSVNNLGKTPWRTKLGRWLAMYSDHDDIGAHIEDAGLVAQDEIRAFIMLWHVNPLDAYAYAENVGNSVWQRMRKAPLLLAIMLPLRYVARWGFLASALLWELTIHFYEIVTDEKTVDGLLSVPLMIFAFVCWLCVGLFTAVVALPPKLAALVVYRNLHADIR